MRARLASLGGQFVLNFGRKNQLAILHLGKEKFLTITKMLSNSFNKIWIIIIIILIGSSGFYILVRKQVFTQREISNSTSQSLVSPLFNTWPGWMNTQLLGHILIRDSGNKKLLLTVRDEFEKGNKHRAVFLYDPNAQNLQQVSDEKWDVATNPITECFSQSQQFPEKFKVNGEKLFFGNQEVPIKGTVLIASAYSLGGDKVAILTADGPRKGSIMPFLGGGQSSKGQHYHQLFSVGNGTQIGDVVKLPFTTEKEAYPACWSADGKYIFYTALLNENLTVVKTNFLNQ